MVFQNITELEMLKSGLGYFHSCTDTINAAVDVKRKHRDRFKSAYGASPSTCSAIFRDIQLRDIGAATITEVNVKHFLVTLFWLKWYPTEVMMLLQFGVECEKTIRKWIWSYCLAIQALYSYKVRASSALHIAFYGTQLSKPSTSFIAI